MIHDLVFTNSLPTSILYVYKSVSKIFLSYLPTPSQQLHPTLQHPSKPSKPTKPIIIPQILTKTKAKNHAHRLLAQTKLRFVPPSPLPIPKPAPPTPNTPNVKLFLTSLKKGNVRGLARRKGEHRFWRTGFEVEECVLEHEMFRGHCELPPLSASATRRRERQKQRMRGGMGVGCCVM